MRDWPIIDDRTLHLIGDIHWGHIYRSRLTKVLQDLQSGYEDVAPQLRVQVGDGTHYTQQLQLEGFVAWMDSLPPAARTEAVSGQARSWAAIRGNHDVVVNALTREDEDDSYGYNGVVGNWSTETDWPGYYAIDLTWVRLLMVSWDSVGSGAKLTTDQMAWLDVQLTAAGSQECWLVVHPPLRNTVLGPTTGLNSVYDSTITGFYLRGPGNTDTEINDLLASHDNARAVLSGHTHSPLPSPGLVSEVTLGGKTVACINAGALVWSYEDEEERAADAWTTYLRRDDDGLVVSWRDHIAGAWTGRNSQRTIRVSL